MKITTVRFRRLQSHDRGYGHDAVEAEAQVEDGETADEAIAALKTWVANELSHLKKVADLSHTAEQLMYRVKSYEEALARTTQQVERQRGIILQHEKLVELANANGLAEAVKDIDDGIPF